MRQKKTQGQGIRYPDPASIRRK